VDRASDAIRHGNYQGTSARGGVVLAVGDDHIAKSSSIVCYSDDVVAGMQVPLFYPADAAEIVEYGLHGFALSRHTGSWTALKIITEVADSTRTVDTDELAIDPILPPVNVPAFGLHNRGVESPLEQEDRQINHRLPAAHAYVRRNGLDRVVFKAAGAKIGIISAGKSWLDLAEGLRLLGLDEARMRELGIALYKPAMIWPLEPEGLAEFAAGLETLIIVEEKTGFIERQVKDILYNVERAPTVWGKRGPNGAILFSAVGDLTPERIAASLGALIGEPVADAAQRACASLDQQSKFAVAPLSRKPFFCSGCPHNRSTVLPEGSRATSGIGCHGLSSYNRPSHSLFAQMGGEGIHWMGLSPFTEEKHIFANLGDGTYFHSGILAIRQAVSAKLNITYKLLYNSAVAMTGGQSVDGELSVAQIVDQIRAEGVGTIIISTDDPGRYPAGDLARAKADGIEHRDDLEALQIRLRETPGVSVIVYEQMCATEKRRLRKRGKLEDPNTRIFINELVCEGCGDCSVKSNCLSVEPVETAFGTKRRINQSSCNKDFSCVTGFCPSFVSVEGSILRKVTGISERFDPATLPTPVVAASAHQRIMVAGVGGTGVVTIGALAAMAAHISGQKAGVLDQVGLAQKGGAVVSHIHLSQEPITALRIPEGQADLVLACDSVVGNMEGVMAAVASGRTHVIANADVSITGDFTTDRDAAPDAKLLTGRLRERAGDNNFAAHPFTRLAEKLFGDAIGSNLMMVGLAYQKGWIALDMVAFEAAINLNGTATAMNKAAIAWGRRLAVEPEAVYAAAGLVDAAPDTLDQLIERRATFLTDYQNAAYADRFRDKIVAVRAAEVRVGGDGALATAAAKSLFKLMAYKDEYEVARLYTEGSFKNAVGQAFEGDVKLSFHLAPPIFAKRDPANGQLRKRTFGAWMMPVLGLLAKGKGLRGTALDMFGRTKERRDERQMILDFEVALDRLIAGLTPATLTDAITIAAMPLEVRGYGHVKEAARAAYKEQIDERLVRYNAPVLVTEPVD
jgi:indolepyruvate ferredoxin oxidoreductase